MESYADLDVAAC